MTRLGLRAAGLAACSVWVGIAGPVEFTTVEQRDPLRSARAIRTVDVSANGRYVAFESWARLVPADTDQRPDIYVLDRETSRVTLESDDVGDTENSHPRISGDGRLLVFEARATRVEDMPRVDIVLRDRTAAANRRLTDHARGARTDYSRSPDISDDGTVVAFASAASTIVEGPDANGPHEDVYVMELATGAIQRVSVSNAGVQSPHGSSAAPSLSADGRCVVFSSTAPLALADASQQATASSVRYVFVRDRRAGTTTAASRTPRGGRPNGDSSLPTISADGRYVVFMSVADNLRTDDGNRGSDVFLFDRDTNVTTLVSRAANGSSANGASITPVISANGQFVAFQSDAGNLVCASRCAANHEDINLIWDAFVFDRTTATTVRVSEDELGGWMEWSAGPAIDGSGQVVAFSSRHPTDPDDRGEDLDLFIRQRSR